MAHTNHFIKPMFVKEYDVAKFIEHYGYYNYCIYRSKTFKTVDEWLLENYKSDLCVSLKKALAKNNKQLWLKLCYKPKDVRAQKGYTEKAKTSWRQSFRSNFCNVDFENWDYYQYPKLKSKTMRQL